LVEVGASFGEVSSWASALELPSRPSGDQPSSAITIPMLLVS